MGACKDNYCEVDYCEVEWVHARIIIVRWSGCGACKDNYCEVECNNYNELGKANLKSRNSNIKCCWNMVLEYKLQA